MSKTLYLFADDIFAICLPLNPSLVPLRLQSTSSTLPLKKPKPSSPPLRERITDALKKLEAQAEVGEVSGASEEEITKAREVIKSAKEATKK